MRKGLFLLAGVALLSSSVASAAPQAGAGAKPQPPAAGQPASTPIKPAAERKEMKLTAKVLNTYVGEYQMGPDRTLTISLKDGYLWGQPTGQDPRQMFPETQTVFFLKDLAVEVTFKKDAKGVVTGMLMKQEGRPDRELAKIK